MLILAVGLLLSCAHPRASLQIPTIEAKKQLSGHIVFNAEIDWGTVGQFVEALSEADKGNAPIVVEVNTPGGSVFAGFEMSRAIENTKNPVVCVVDGMAASMGLYILQSCDIRIMTHRSLLMGHQPGSGAMGQQDEIKKVGTILEKLNLVLAAHITYRMTITVNQYLELIAHGNELWLTADEALELKAIDFKVESLRQVELLIH